MPSIRLNLTVNDDGSVALKKFRSNAKRAFDGARQDADKFGVKAAAAIAAVGYAAIQLANQVGKLAKDSAMLAARYETLGIVMKVVGNNAGYSGAEMDAFSKQLQKTGISMIESRSNIVKLAQAQLDLTKSSELARIAQDAAVIGNINSSEAFGRLVHGIQSAQVEVLRTIGINVVFEEGYKRLAKELGKSVTELTANEKAQSRMNQVLQYGARIAGTYEAAMTTTGKKISSLPRYIEDAMTKLGAAFGPALGFIVDEMTAALKGISKWADDNQITIAEWGLTFKKIIVSVVVEIRRLAMLLDKVGGTMTTIGMFLTGPGAALGIDSSKRRFEEFARRNMEYEERYRESEREIQRMADDLVAAENALAVARVTGVMPGQTNFAADTVKPAQPVIAASPVAIDYQKLADEAYRLNEQEVEAANKLEEAHMRLANMALPEHAREIANVRQQYELAQKEVTELAAANQITWEDATKLSADLNTQMQKELDDLAKKGQETFGEDLKNAVSGWASHFSKTLSDAIFKGKDGFKGLLDSFTDMLGQMIIQKQIVEPMLNSMTGTGGLLSALFSADGNVFSGGRHLTAYAAGGVVGSPTIFPMANGGVGLMGEAGPEAIMPLKRGPDGTLGVGGGGGSTVFEVNIFANDAKSFDDMVKRNPQSIVNAFMNAAQRGDKGLRDTLRAVR